LIIFLLLDGKEGADVCEFVLVDDEGEEKEVLLQSGLTAASFF